MSTFDVQNRQQPNRSPNHIDRGQRSDSHPSLEPVVDTRPQAIQQRALDTRLNYNARAQSQRQLRQMLNGSPRVVAQMKLAAALSGRASAPQPIQLALSFKQLEAIHATFTQVRNALGDIAEALEKHELTGAEAHARYMSWFERLEGIDTDGSEATEDQRVELMGRVLEEAENHGASITRSTAQETAAPAKTLAIQKLVREDKLEAALSLTCDTFGLDECPVLPTAEYASVLPSGTPLPPGTPFGVTVGGPRETNSPPVRVYIHTKWIRHWVSNTDQIGNLVDTIQHEQTHARQRKNPRYTDDAKEDVKEFEAYASEVVAAQNRVDNQAAAHLLPTEPAILIAIEKAREHFHGMELADRTRFQAQLDHVEVIWARLQPALSHADDARNATQADEIGFENAAAELHKNRGNLESPTVALTSETLGTLFDKANGNWRSAMSYYNGITKTGRARLASLSRSLESDHEACLNAFRLGPLKKPVAKAVDQSARESPSPAVRLLPPSSPQKPFALPPPPMSRSLPLPLAAPAEDDADSDDEFTEFVGSGDKESSPVAREEAPVVAKESPPAAKEEAWNPSFDDDE